MTLQEFVIWCIENELEAKFAPRFNKNQMQLIVRSYDTNKSALFNIIIEEMGKDLKLFPFIQKKCTEIL